MSSFGRRSRLKLAVLILFIIGAGLFTRSSRGSVLPVFIQQYAGDTLWALALYTFLAFVSPGAAAKELLLLSVFISYAVEFSQLYQADWINSIRSVKIGGLILGYGFSWSDMLCYTTGILVGFAVDFRKRNLWR